MPPSLAIGASWSGEHLAAVLSRRLESGDLQARGFQVRRLLGQDAAAGFGSEKEPVPAQREKISLLPWERPTFRF